MHPGTPVQYRRLSVILETRKSFLVLFCKKEH